MRVYDPNEAKLSFIKGTWPLDMLFFLLTFENMTAPLPPAPQLYHDDVV